MHRHPLEADFRVVFEADGYRGAEVVRACGLGSKAHVQPAVECECQMIVAYKLSRLKFQTWRVLSVERLP